MRGYTHSYKYYCGSFEILVPDLEDLIDFQIWVMQSMLVNQSSTVSMIYHEELSDIQDDE